MSRWLRQRRRAGRTKRTGAAAVELAVCLPLIALIVFGSIEAANGIYLKQVATQAAYEAARVVTSPGGTQQDALTIAQEVLDARKIKDASVTFNPQVTSSTPAGTAVSVRVEAPLDQNALAPAWFFRGAEFSATVRMSRN